jgi:PAS domain S-box-containing protein
VAVEHLSNTLYDIVLLDLGLPDSSGMETVRGIRSINPRVPVVVLTGLDDEQMGILAIRNGATDYLVKGQSLDTLLVRTICYALEREREKNLTFDAGCQLQETNRELFATKKKLEKKAMTLQHIRDELESRVRQRTAELTKANEILNEEISAREKLERALKVSEANLHRVILASPDGILVVDGNGIVQFVNPAAESIFGRRKEELLGQSFGLPLTKGEVTEVDIVGHGREGGIAEMRVVETDWNGQNACVALLHDVTDLKHAEERMGRIAQEWQTTFDSITEMISIHDANWKIIRVNKALADAMEKEPEELIGMKCCEVFHNTEQACRDCPHLRTLETGKPATLELSESCFGVQLGMSTWPIFDDTGKVTASVHIAYDITKRKLAEEKLLEANEKLTEYNCLKDEFVSTASHELRTPLSIIMGAVRLVLDEIPGPIVPEQRDVLTVAMENVKRLGRLVDSLLTISKIESGKSDLQISSVNICELVENTVLDCRTLGQEQGVRLDCEVPQTGIDVRLDSDKTKEVLMNLISNSLKFTPEGGWAKVTCARRGSRVLLTVQDSGVGIAKEDIPKLFDKFTQFGRKYGPGEKGTGLGLAIVKKLVEKHGGTIEVESEIGKGTTFVVSLPLVAEAGAGDMAAKEDELVEHALIPN